MGIGIFVEARLLLFWSLAQLDKYYDGAGGIELIILVVCIIQYTRRVCTKKIEKGVNLCAI